MAINTQKFLPSSKGGTLAKLNKTIIKSSSPIALSGKSLRDLSVIKVKVIEIDSILKGTLAVEKKKLTESKKQDSSKRREKVEEKLETKPKAESGKIKTPSLPRMGFLDWVKNFIGNVILGYFAVRLVDHLPKIIPIVKFLGKATDFVLGVGGKLLDGLVTFIDWGYKAYDATRGFVKNLFGNSEAKQFDQLSSALNQFLNLAIIAGMVVAGSGGKGRGTSAAKPRVPTSGGSRNPLRRRPKVTTGRGGNRALLSSVRPFLKRIPLPVVGALVDFGLSVALGENPGRAAFRAIGAGLLGAVGAAAGTVVPVAGNFIGGLLGGVAGDAIGGVLYDFFFGSGMPSGKGKVVKKAGGGATRGGRPQRGVKRTISKKSRYRRRLTPQKPGDVEANSPGADVGGEEKLFGLFPNPFKMFQKAADVMNPFKVIQKAGQNLGDSDYFGPILSITSKILLGQKPSQQDYKNVGLGINMLVAKGIDDGKLKGGLAAFAEGGFVDPKTLDAISQGGDISDWVAKSFKDSTETNAQKTLREIQENLRLKKDQGVNQDKGIDQQPDPNLDVGAGGFNVTGGNADFWSLVAIASLESGTPQGRADVAQSIYNRLSSGIYSGNTIKELIVSGNGRQYQPVGRAVREFRSISDKQSAINAVMVANKLSRVQAEKFINDTASAIQNKELQKSAAQFVGGRTDFWAQGLTPPSNGLGYVVRHGHRFGWFVGPAAIAYGRKNPGPANAPQLGDIVVMGGSMGGMVKGGKAFPLPKGMIGTGPGQVYGAPRGYGGHAGVDVVEKPPWGGNPRLPIVAYSGGKVLSEKFVPNDPYLSGLMIDHGGVQTRYLHATPNVRPGQTVQPGQKIGNLLNLGNQTHLHFEAYKGSQRLNPTDMLRAAYEKGGMTLGGPHMAMLGEKGKEFVVDADSTAAIEQTFPGFLGALNTAKYEQAINVLRNFASYESGSEQVVVIADMPTVSSSGYDDSTSGGSVYVGGEEESDPFSTLYQGG
jgi:murein DD-endopeptidase MepM/ murein hydrolase activator NlpD